MRKPLLVLLALVALGCAADDPRSERSDRAPPAVAPVTSDDDAIVMRGSKHADADPPPKRAVDRERIDALEREAKGSEKKSSGGDLSRPAAVGKGKTAPALALSSWHNSAALRLDDLLGKVVLLHFFAEWSEASADTFDPVESFHERYGSRGLVVIGIHVKSGAAEGIQTVVTEHRLRYAVAADLQGTTAARYDVAAIPAFVIVGRDGLVRSTGNRVPREADVEAALGIK
jgi:peroxiredoxin